MAFEKTIRINIVADSKGVSTGIEHANAKLSTLEKTVGRIGRSFTAFFALMAGREVVRQIGDSVNQFANFEYQLALVGRAAGITGKELSSLGEGLRDIALVMGEDINQLEALAIQAGRAGIKTKEAMTDIAVIASKMGAVTDLSAVEATTALIKLQKNFGYTAKQIGSSIAWAGKEVLASEGEITQAVLRMIDSGKTLGIDFPTLVALAATSLESAGQRASRVGNEWSAAIRKMVDNADLVAISIGMDTQAFRELINTHPDQALFLIAEELNKIQDNARKVQLETQLFGSTGGKVLPYLREQLDKTREIISGVNSEIKTGGAYLDSAYGGVADTLKKKTDRLSASFRDLKISVADLIDVPLANWYDSLSHRIRLVSKDLQEQGGILTTNKWLLEKLETMFVGPLKRPFGAPPEEMLPQQQNLLTDKTKKALEDLSAYKKGVDLGKIEVTGKAPSVTDPFAAARLEINAEAEKIAQMKQMWEAYRSSELSAKMQTQQAEMEQFNFLMDTQKKAHESLWATAGNLRDTFSQGISNMFMDMIKGTFDAKKAFADLGMQMLKILIDWMVQKAVNMALEWALMPVLKMMASTMASIWAVPAFLAAVASSGGAVAAAVTSLAGGAIAAQGIAKFAKGGIVPGMGRGDRVPALLEPGELVVPRNRVNQMTNNSYAPVVNVSMEGALVMDSPVAVEKLYRNYLRERIREDIKGRRDTFYG